MAALSWQINKRVFLAINGQDLETFERTRQYDKLTAFKITRLCRAAASSSSEVEVHARDPCPPVAVRVSRSAPVFQACFYVGFTYVSALKEGLRIYL